MKKTIILLLLLLLTSMLLCGCANKPIKAECDVITIRPYSTVEEKGVFTTKEERIDYIEYTFEYDEKIYLKTVKSQYLEIGSETKVLITDGENYLLNELVLSLEDYKELYGVTEFYKFND